MFPLYFQNSLNPRYPPPAPFVSALIQIPVGCPVTLWLICWSFMHSLCCNCCSLVALAFFSCFFHVSLTAEKVRLKRRSRLYQEKQKHTLGSCGAPSLIGTCFDQYQSFNVVFESPASAAVLYQLSLTGNASGAYLRGDESRAEEKTREALRKICRQTEVEKEISCQNIVLKWWWP